jgi:hypothetical protein
MVKLGLFCLGVAALLSTACGAPPAAEAPTAPPEPVVVAAPAEEETEGASVESDGWSDDALFLWTVAGEEDPQTYWVESVEGTLAVRGVVNGVVLAVAGQVLQRKTELETVTTAPCGPLGPGVEAPSGGQAQRGWFEPVGDASPRQVVIEPTRKSELSSFEEWLQPVGSAGSYVFIRLHQQAYACGAAHGGHSSAVFVWDLGRGERAQVDLGEFDSPELRDVAHEQLREHALDESQGASALRLHALLPTYDRRGHLSLARAYVTDACYACSDAWGSYLRGATIPGPPPRWEGVRARAPELVAAFLRHRPQQTLRGWSRAPRFDGSPAAVRRLFAAASHASQDRAP